MIDLAWCVLHYLTASLSFSKATADQRGNTNRMERNMETQTVETLADSIVRLEIAIAETASKQSLIDSHVKQVVHEATSTIDDALKPIRKNKKDILGKVFSEEIDNDTFRQNLSSVISDETGRLTERKEASKKAKASVNLERLAVVALKTSVEEAEARRQAMIVEYNGGDIVAKINPVVCPNLAEQIARLME